MRFTIGHKGVTNGQKHSADLFRTDNIETAKTWLGMGFRVWDRVNGDMHTLGCFYRG